MAEKKTVCVYLPLFNEVDNLPDVFRRVEAVVAKESGYDWTFLLVDNGSTDGSEALCDEKAASDPRYRYIRLSRNWVEGASLVPLDYCFDDAMITVFTDLQDPPEKIPLMLRKWEEGYAIVNGIVGTRHDSSLFKSLGAAVAYRLIDWLTDANLPKSATDFRLLDRKVIEALRACQEWPRFSRGLVHWIGFKKAYFEYDRTPRVAGVSKGTFLPNIRLTLEAVFNFSDKPLRMISGFGIFVLTLAVILACLYSWGAIFGKPPRGITTVFVLVLANIGLTSFFLGVIGEYLGRTFVQSKRRPIYFVEKTANVDKREP